MKKIESKVPFDPPYKRVKSSVTVDKSGAKHGPMSKAKHLSQLAMKDAEKKVKDLRKEKTEVDELNKSTMARYTRAAARDINLQGVRGNTDKIKKRFKGIDTATHKLAMRKEDTQIDELSKNTLGKYINRATANNAVASHYGGSQERRASDAMDKGNYKVSNKAQASADRMYRKSQKRQKGIEKAVNRLTKEDTQIDELSKNTLGSYIGKATDDKQMWKGVKKAFKKKYGRTEWEDSKIAKRNTGIKKAASRLAKEDAQFDESIHHDIDHSDPDFKRLLKKHNVTHSVVKRGPQSGDSIKLHGDKKNVQHVSKVLRNPEQHQNEDLDLKLYNLIAEEAYDEAIELFEKNEKEMKMASSQVEFIEYAAEEIEEWLESNDDTPEWFQNKLTKAFTIIEELHSYVEGDEEQGDDAEEMKESKEVNELSNDLLQRYDDAKEKKHRQPDGSTKYKSVHQSLKRTVGGIRSLKRQAGFKAPTNKVSRADHFAAYGKDGHKVVAKHNKKVARESVELDELSPATLNSYQKKATDSAGDNALSHPTDKKAQNILRKRFAGLKKANKRLGETSYEKIRGNKNKSDDDLKPTESMASGEKNLQLDREKAAKAKLKTNDRTKIDAIRAMMKNANKN